jgi:hypothetical protein
VIAEAVVRARHGTSLPMDANACQTSRESNTTQKAPTPTRRARVACADLEVPSGDDWGRASQNRGVVVFAVPVDMMDIGRFKSTYHAARNITSMRLNAYCRRATFLAACGTAKMMVAVALTAAGRTDPTFFASEIPALRSLWIRCFPRRVPFIGALRTFVFSSVIFPATAMEAIERCSSWRRISRCREWHPQPRFHSRDGSGRLWPGQCPDSLC